VSVTALDKVAKKVAFLTQVQVELDLRNLQCVHARVERWSSGRLFDVIVSRAFAALAEFVGTTRHLLAPAGHWCAMKGALPEAELRDLDREQPDVEVVRTVKLRVPRLTAERHLIVMRR
jgi:16S rRNA (guanine527-N7)-methyltransferase